jgi:hypothetical protein
MSIHREARRAIVRLLELATSMRFKEKMNSKLFIDNSEFGSYNVLAYRFDRICAGRQPRERDAVVWEAD